MEQEIKLLLKEEEEVGGIKEEVKRLGWIAAPMVAVTMSEYLLQSSSITLVGHLGELPLASTALAVSITNVTGLSLMVGMASALETLCGEAYGAQQHEKLGTKTFSAILSLILACIPISILWINLERLLILIGQDAFLSHEAGKYAICLIPSLFANAILQPIVGLLQDQSLTTPMLMSSLIALSLHLPLCWVLIFKTNLGSLGAAVATGLPTWFNVIYLGFYVRFSWNYERTCPPLSVKVLRGVGEFFRFAVPSTAMMCLEWWSFELMILLSGTLPDPALETSVLSVCLATIETLYAMPAGIGAAASTRVSNDLGAGNPNKARTTIYGVMLIVVIGAITMSSIVFIAHDGFGHLFSNEKEVVGYVNQMAPLICISIILDTLQGALSGIMRGCGKQHIAACGVLVTYYIVGIPLAILLAFRLKLRGKGLWIGIQTGTFLQILVFGVVIASTNWETQARRARERLFKEDFEINNRHDVLELR